MLTRMPSLRIDDVPEDVLAILKRRAENLGESLSNYIRTVLIIESEKPEPFDQEAHDKLMAEIAAEEPIDVTTEEIVEIIRKGRGEWPR